MANETKVIEVCGIMAAAYPNFNLTKQTIAVYARVLQDVPDEVLEAAALDAVSRSKFFPTIAELRESAYMISANRLAVPSAFEAWDEVVHQIRDVGSYGEPVFSHPWIGTAIRQIGGWRNICQSENSIADRARFFECYADAERRHDMTAKTLPQVTLLAKKLQAQRQFAQLLSGDGK